MSLGLTRASRLGLLLASLIGLTAAAGDGWDAYASGHFTEAVTIWTRQAMAGDADAQFGLGIAYDLGQGVGQDEARACVWYRRAGERGVVAAAFDVAVMLDQARCGSRDPAQVAEWYGRAAAAGHARSEYNLAQLYEAGDGVPRNLDQAAVWYRLAAANGLAAAAQKASLLARRKPEGSGPIVAAAPVTPGDGPVPDRGLPVAFVWSAPPQPRPVRFFIEIDALQADGAHEIAARYADQSAVLVTLPPGSARYAWRVFAIQADSQRYAASPWRRFEVAGRTNE